MLRSRILQDLVNGRDSFRKMSKDENINVKQRKEFKQAADLAQKKIANRLLADALLAAFYV
jgi:hypothetical protein